MHQVIVNGLAITEETIITPADRIAFTFPVPRENGQLTADTMDTDIPYQGLGELDLALIPQENGQLNWAYNDMLDSSFNKIMVVASGGRSGWDPTKETVVADEFKANVSQDTYSGNGSILMTSYHPDNLVYETSSTDKQLAVFSEVYYPLGWKAYIDGNEVDISRVNYVLRAIEVPAGDHKVEFVYQLESYEKSGTYAMIGNIILLLLLAGGIFFEVKRKDDDEKADNAESKEEVSEEIA
jgi:hypothetical protein